MAGESINTENIAKALKEVAENGEQFLNNDPAAREKLVASARQLVTAAEKPVESLLWNIWALPTRTVAARIAIDLKIFETSAASTQPLSVADLAAPTGASPILVQRIARAVVSMGMLAEQGPDAFVPNDLTKLLATKEYAAGIVFCFDITQEPFAKLPEYLRKTGFRNPQDANDGPFQHATGSPSAFLWLVQHPPVFEAFHGYVHALREHRPAWTEMYPVGPKLVEGLRPEGDASALIDVGGGMGQVLQDFHAAVPEYTGRLVLQEIPEVVGVATEKGVGASGRIELQVHDFFKEQPVKGARAYFMRSVLHDWPDEQCRVILKNLKDVMEIGYSKILINDCVVSDQAAAWQHIALDLYMMAQVSSRERTEGEWRALIESCEGLELTGIYNKGDGNEGLIEVVRTA